MVNEFLINKILIVGMILFALVMVSWIGWVEYKENKTKERERRQANARRHRLIMAAQQHQINEDWKNAD